MTLWLWEQASVVRHLGYPVQGLNQNAPAGGSLAYGNAGYRFFESYGPLLYRLTQLAPNEESRLTGAAYGAVGFTGLDPVPGDQVSITISGGNIPGTLTKSVTVPSFAPGLPPWSLLTVSANLASQFASDPAFNSAGFIAIADYGAGPYTQAARPNPMVSFRSPMGVNNFALSVGSTGLTSGQIVAPPNPLSPFISFRRTGQNNCIFGFLPILDYLEGAYGGATIDLGIMQANNVTMRMDELEQRDNLYEKYRQKLSAWLKIPLGDNTPYCGDGGPSNLRASM